MKRICIYIIVGIVVSLTACSEDDAIGYVPPLEPDYVLPTGTAVDDTIAMYYERYGSYILYKYTDLEFYYESNVDPDWDSYESADPLYVGDMLSLLKEIWFDFYPTEFHQKYMPYRIFLASRLIEFDEEIFALVGTNALYVGSCSEVLKNLAPEDKLEYKKILQRLLWSKWGLVMDIPEDFVQVSDYITPLDDDSEQARNRGFLSGFFDDGEEYEWSSELNYYSQKELEQRDFCSFLIHMTTSTSSELAQDLSYPLVKKKYDILKEWFNKKYGIDLQKVGDTTYN